MKSFSAKYIDRVLDFIDRGIQPGDREKVLGGIVLFIIFSMGTPRLLYLILLCISMYGFYLLYQGVAIKNETDDESKIVFLTIQLIVIVLAFIHFLFHFILGL